MSATVYDFAAQREARRKRGTQVPAQSRRLPKLLTSVGRGALVVGGVVLFAARAAVFLTMLAVRGLVRPLLALACLASTLAAVAAYFVQAHQPERWIYVTGFVLGSLAAAGVHHFYDELVARLNPGKPVLQRGRASDDAA